MGRKARAAASTSGSHRNERGGNRSARASKRGSTSGGEDYDDLVQQLAPLGLVVRKMDTDGNCLFRAFADQFCGDSEEHMQYRGECCDYIQQHTEEFAVFHADDDEDEESFETYLERMRSPGVWGSQLELMALCQKYQVNAIVHQASMPSYEMVAAPLDARCLQLSYHDGEHYNSVRLASNVGYGQPARCLTLRQIRGGQSEADDKNGEEPEDVKQLRDLLPPDFAVTPAALRAALASAAGDAEAAAEALLSETVGGGGGDGGHGAAGKAEGAAGKLGAVVDAQSHAPSSGGQAAQARCSRAEKRADRKRDKQAAEDRRRRARAAARETAEDDGDLPGDAALSLLTKQLLTV